MVAAALLSAAVVGLFAWFLRPPSPESGPPTRFVINTTSGAPLARTSPLALSPNGRQLAYGWILNTLEWTRIEDVEALVEEQVLFSQADRV